MTGFEVVAGISIGLATGVLAGLFGVGGGIVATPAIATVLGRAPIVAVATPLPVIFPTAIAGAITYRRAGHVDLRAVAWMSLPGAVASAAGAALTELVDGEVLLLVTAALLLWQSIGVARGSTVTERPARDGVSPWAFVATGGAAGLVSGLLGVGGGIVIVPLLAGVLGMPLKTALGTSLATIAALVVPGTIVHSALGNVDWAVAITLVVGSVAGANVGARIALGTRERTLRLVVGGFLFCVGIAYAVRQTVELLAVIAPPFAG